LHGLAIIVIWGAAAVVVVTVEEARERSDKTSFGQTTETKQYHQRGLYHDVPVLAPCHEISFLLQVGRMHL